MSTIARLLREPSPRMIRVVALGAGLLVLLLILRRQSFLLGVLQFGDEAETVVAARLLAMGERLYTDVFDQHGPLTFLPGIVVELLGGRSISDHRIPVAILTLLTLLALLRSPLPGDRLVRATAVVVIAVIALVVLPPGFGQMGLYQVVAGLLLAIALAQWVLPSMLVPERVGPWRVALGSAVLVALPFLGVSYAPAAGLLWLAALRRERIRTALTAAAVALAANVVFLLLIADPRAFLAVHVYLNLVLLYPGTPLPYRGRVIVEAFTGSAWGFAGLLATFGAAAVLVIRERGIPWRTGAIVLAVASLLARGGITPDGLLLFQAIPFFWVSVALVLVPLAVLPSPGLRARVVIVGLLVVVLLPLTPLAPGARNRLAATPVRSATPFSTLARIVTSPEDRVVAWTFDPAEYLLADRLPAVPAFFFLPVQGRYAAAPVLGVIADPCADLAAARPKLIRADRWTTEPANPWSGYAACVDAILARDYIGFPGTTSFLRRDLLPADLIADLPTWTGAPASVPGPVLGEDPVALPMSAAHRTTETPLVAVGILLADPGSPPVGEGILRLSGPDGSVEVPVAFPVARGTVSVPVPAGRYTALELLPGGGTPMTTFTVADEDGSPVACLVYGYADGTWRFTEGCPLL